MRDRPPRALTPVGCTRQTALPVVPSAIVVPDRSQDTLLAWPIPTLLVETSTVTKSSTGKAPSPITTAHSRSVPSPPQVARRPQSVPRTPRCQEEKEEGLGAGDDRNEDDAEGGDVKDRA